jgi:hypothetical protein
MGQGAAPAQDWTWWRSSLGVQIGW